MELDEYSRHLQFIPEYPLTTEPLRIDVLIIKKSGHIPIKKNIAAIFREWNLLEYKSPGDYVSVEDFYKVYGYACLYTMINKVPITGLTVSFIESRYPRKLIKHLQKERGYAVEKTSPGIYTISGDILPIQIIDSRMLPEAENLWLKNLSSEHNRFSIARLNKEIDKRGKIARLWAYLHTVISANPKAAEEAINMGNKFDEVMERTGLAAKWEARGEARGKAMGEARGRANVARNAIAQGVSPDLVRKITGLDMKTIKQISKSRDQGEIKERKRRAK